MNLIDHPDFDGHERTLFLQDDVSGLQAIISLHSTALGPAAGGCRLWSYSTPGEALTDALRLSRGMSYKNAMAGLAFGGGKAVILGPVGPRARTGVIRAFGRAVESFAGDYITAEDVGVRVEDMQTIAEETRYVSGLKSTEGMGGDPSPWTALGVRYGIEAATTELGIASSVRGLRVAIQGLGGVGANLCRELSALGVHLTVSDVDPVRTTAIVQQFGATPVGPDDILLADVDVLAPCALGGAITERVASSMRAKVVAGGANNQISTPEAGRILHERSITYVPDYVINAGGIISVCAEYVGTMSTQDVHNGVEAIRNRSSMLIRRSRLENRPPAEIADEMARQRIARSDGSRS